jgi:hypothetical protein
MLRCDFKGLPGELQVIKGLYRITANQQRPLLIDQNSSNDSVIPGSKISMAVVLDEYEVAANICPRCETMLDGFYSSSDTNGVLQYGIWYVLNTRDAIHELIHSQP